MQDMTPPGDRSIRNIPVSHAHRRGPRESLLQDPPRRRPRRSHKLWWWATGVIVLCILGGLLLSTIFEGADITVSPKTQAVTPPTTLSATLNAPAGSMSYQTMTLTESASTTVAATGSTHVSKSATGLVTIYNSYSTAPQKLIANTRLAAPDGKIYRVHVPITVPGEVKGPSGALTPGSVTATIYADAPGADYNRTDPTTFTIPGFQGDPRYSKFSAQSQGSISGGFVGDQATVAPADMSAAQSALKQQLGSAVLAAATSNVPAGFLLATGSVSVNYSDIAQSPASGSTVTLSQSATAVGAVVRTSDLAAAIARQAVNNYNGEAVDFADPSQISVSVGSSTKTGGPITLSLGGAPTLVWQFDENAIKTALVGKDKSAFQTVIQSFEPAVSKATASIRPFWKSTFPSDPNKISIEITH